MAQDDYANKAMSEMAKANGYAENKLWVYLIGAIVFALLQISYTIWEAADKMLYPGGYKK